VSQDFLPSFLEKLGAPTPATVRRPNTGRAPKALGNPCTGCPAEHQPKARPFVVEAPEIVLVEEVPSAGETEAGRLGPPRPLGGPRLSRACLTRCVPFGPEADRHEMRRRCSRYLAADLPRGVPVAALGDEAVYYFCRSRDRGADYWRGLWTRSAHDGRRVYGLREGARFTDDVERLARMLRGPAPGLRRLEVVEDPRLAPELMSWMIAHPGPWAFDVEAYDAGAYPSRPGVATDPCHPDFRLRGVAVAWSEDEGAWLELAPLGPEVWRPFLDRLFSSPARKAASYGHYDEEALVVPGWTGEVRNRGDDALLAWLSLSDGRHTSLRLERLAVDLLGLDPWWAGFDKSGVGRAPLDLVARAAVFDAGCALWLCAHARDLMTRGEYWDGE